MLLFFAFLSSVKFFPLNKYNELSFLVIAIFAGTVAPAFAFNPTFDAKHIAKTVKQLNNLFTETIINALSATFGYYTATNMNIQGIFKKYEQHHK